MIVSFISLEWIFVDLLFLQNATSNLIGFSNQFDQRTQQTNEQSKTTNKHKINKSKLKVARRRRKIHRNAQHHPQNPTWSPRPFRRRRHLPLTRRRHFRRPHPPRHRSSLPRHRSPMEGMRLLQIHGACLQSHDVLWI